MENYPWVAIIGQTTILNFGNLTLMSRKKISILHPYLESRRSEIEANLYPKNHLWGIDALESSDKFEINFIKTNKISLQASLKNYWTNQYLEIHLAQGQNYLHIFLQKPQISSIQFADHLEPPNCTQIK